MRHAATRFGLAALAVLFTHPAAADVWIKAPVWTAAPSLADVRAVTPKRLAGHTDEQLVVLTCKLDADGSLKNCGDTRPYPFPNAADLKSAALSLAADFKVQVTDEVTAAKAAAVIDFRVLFHDPTIGPAPLELTDPQYLAKSAASFPSPVFPDEATRAGLKSGEAVVDCLGAADGSLSDCSAVVEYPTGVGFGRSALAAVEASRLNPWQWGEPVAGARVRIPIFFGPVATPADPSLVHLGVVSAKSADEKYPPGDFYPELAHRLGTSGIVVLECVLAANGRLDLCVSANESPGGMGFGAAAEMLAHHGYVTLPSEFAGDAKPGQIVWVAVQFKP